MKIAAVIVTYNRLSDLKHCIRAIRDQTVKPDTIIVVDNGSDDGTDEWLKGQKDLTVLRQSNSGSAGGQRTGIALTVEEGYDWVWCFDDDCRPEKHALERLLPHMKNNSTAVYNSVPLYDNDTFAFFAYESKSYSDMIGQVNNNIYTGFQGGFFYIGCAISREIVLDVGLPIAELFIRGDEVEYHSRIAERYPVYTIPRSIVYHPREEYFYIEPVRNFTFRFPKNFTPLKLYYHVRNNLMLSYRYPKHTFRIPVSFIKNTSLTMYVILRHYRSREFFAAFFRGIKDSIVQYRQIFTVNGKQPAAYRQMAE